MQRKVKFWEPQEEEELVVEVVVVLGWKLKPSKHQCHPYAKETVKY